MPDRELTCGEELSASAEVPEAIGKLLAHVAINLREHAAWVGTAEPAARREHDALLEVAAAYASLGRAGANVAILMRSFATLEPARHDPTYLARDELIAWMREKIALQRALADLLLEHVGRSERGLEAMLRMPP